MPDAASSAGTDQADLIRRLRRIVGEAHVEDNQDDLASAVRDILRIYSAQPICVVAPGSTREVAEVVRACRDSGVPIVPMGGNTGLAGGAVAVPDRACVTLSLRRMNRVRAMDATGQTITVDAGCIVADVQAHAATVGRLFPLSLTAEGSCQVGGVISTNAGGVNALRYGVMRDLVLGLEVVLCDGQILDMNRRLFKDNAGLDLKHLFIGANGTLGVVTGAVLKLFPAHQTQATAMVGLASIGDALTMMTLLASRFGPRLVSLELIDRATLELVIEKIDASIPPFTPLRPWQLLIELADQDLAAALETALEDALAAAFEDGLISDAVVAKSRSQSDALWRLRHDISEVMRHCGPRFANDVSVPSDRIEQFVADLKVRISNVAACGEVLVFGHIGDGNLHIMVCFPGQSFDPEEWRAIRNAAEAEIDALIVDNEGSVTAEHGIGLSYRHRLSRSRSALEVSLMRQIKTALDPANLMNPGKVYPD